MVAVDAAQRRQDNVALFEKRDPKDDLQITSVRLPRWQLEKAAAVAERERATGAESPWTGREISRDDIIRTALKHFLSIYEAEHGKLEVPVEPQPAEPAKKKPAAKKGGR